VLWGDEKVNTDIDEGTDDRSRFTTEWILFVESFQIPGSLFDQSP